MTDEFRSLEHIKSFFLIILSIIITLFIAFKSKFVQLAFLFGKSRLQEASASYAIEQMINAMKYYYPMVSYYVLGMILPIICMMIVYDAVYRDLEDERVRMLITKVGRMDYLLSKLFSRLLILITSLIIIMLFVMFFSFFEVGKVYLGLTLSLFFSLMLMIIFLTTVYLLISCFAKNPLLISILFIFVSSILLALNSTKAFSFYTYFTMSIFSTRTISFFISGSMMFFMANVFFFNRKRL